MTEDERTHDLAFLNASLKDLSGRIRYVNAQFLDNPPRWAILLFFEKPYELESPDRESQRLSDSEDELSLTEKRLFQELKEWRKALAKSEGVKPYVIAHNRHLLELVRRKPKDLHDLYEIPGWGSRKIARYGQEILKIVLSHFPNTGRQERSTPADRLQAEGELRWCTKCKKAVQTQTYSWRGHTAYRCPHCFSTLGWS